ncbi:flap endonuclease-1 [archaeon]|jgi:flap endonuclease-1|nr:flap endonuclease-1 [archaeon]MBT4397677.1 flap endonuclease-1 [archaeon]MBT4441627.1 flap endonuclease-1 [archaeon]
MGIKLGDLVEKKDVKWDSLQGKTLAIDASNVLYQFASSIRQQDGTPLMNKEGKVTSHLVGLFSRVPNMVQKGIKPVFVFDGEPPQLKALTQQKRRENKDKAKEKYMEAAAKEDENLMEFYSKQFTGMNQEMFDEAKELLEAMGLPTVQAPSEAEAQCAYMCKKKKVYAVGSQDYDTLLFGGPKLIQNLTLSQKRKVSGGRYVLIAPYLIELKQVLDSLELNQEELILWAILVGTDYNPGGVKGIGPKKALKLIQSGKKPELIFDELECNFDWKVIFDTFKHIPVSDVNLKFGELDVDRIKEILIERHDFTETRVDNVLEKLQKKEKESLKKWF